MKLVYLLISLPSSASNDARAREQSKTYGYPVSAGWTYVHRAGQQSASLTGSSRPYPRDSRRGDAGRHHAGAGQFPQDRDGDRLGVTWKNRLAAGRVPEKPNPSVPSDTHRPGRAARRKLADRDD
jgi:hypothetical protein